MTKNVRPFYEYLYREIKISKYELTLLVLLKDVFVYPAQQQKAEYILQILYIPSCTPGLCQIDTEFSA
jgi:hypothetical protein